MVLKPRSPGNSRAAPALKPNSRDIWDAATKGDDAAITHLLEQGVAVDATDGVSDRRHTRTPLTRFYQRLPLSKGWHPLGPTGLSPQGGYTLPS